MEVVRKVAFCFIVRDKIFNQEIWKSFFESLDVDFEIFCHYKKKPKIIFNVNYVECIETKWGDRSLVDATNIMYREAFYVHSCEVAYLLSGDTLPMYNNFKRFIKFNSKTTFKTQSKTNISKIEKNHTDFQYANLSKYLKQDKFLPRCKWEKAHMFFCINREDFIKIEDSKLLDTYFHCIQIPDENYWINSMTLLKLNYVVDPDYIFSNWYDGSTQALNINLINNAKINVYDINIRDFMNISHLESCMHRVVSSKLLRKVLYELGDNTEFYHTINGN